MSDSKSIYLGVDGGGTKTEAIIQTQTGHIVGRGIASGSNPHNHSESEVISNILDAIKQASSTLSDPVFDTVVLGIAGLDTDSEIKALKLKLQGRIQADNFQMHNDGFIGLKSGTNSSFGVCLIASTGSNCFAINQSGQQVKAGDWGYLLGDQGSGFAIGLELIKLAVKEHDGRKPDTGLMTEINHRLKVSNFASLLQFIYQHKPPIQAISSLAKITSEEKYTNNPDVIKITQSTTAALFDSFAAVIIKSKLELTQNIPLVLVGKLFLAKQLITNPLSQLITKNYPQVKIIIPSLSPAESAVKIARNRF